MPILCERMIKTIYRKSQGFFLFLKKAPFGLYSSNRDTIGLRR